MASRSGTLSVGTRIGPYEIVQFRGAGGMGEVYRARDAKLQRDVAIKILPDALVGHAGALARFRREAQLLASLNQPNIATVHGFEDSGGVRALVMEFVEGRTLTSVMAGGLSLDESIAIARQIAHALEAAHEQGIIHRDLKPANIMIRDDGAVKVLDFGLAKALAPGRPLDDAVRGDLATVTAPAMTGQGVILGTAAYMSPEQARGQPVDRRSDIWAFGVVLYEMVTGRRPFKGDHVADVIAAVVKDTPDLGAAPASLRRLLAKCLEKDPRKRLRDISSAELLLDGMEEIGAAAPAVPVGSGRPWPMNRAGALTGMAVLAVIAVSALAFTSLQPAEPEVPPIEFVMEAPPGTAFVNLPSGNAASPDGQHIVLSAAEAGQPVALWLRRLGQTDARRLPGTEGGTAPMWSPDSQSIAFMAQKTLKRIDLAGGLPVTLAEVPNADADQPGAWSPDGLILFGCPCGLDSVPATGGKPTMLRRVDRDAGEMRYGSPQFLLDGKSFIYFVESSDPKIQGVYASTLADPSERTLILNTNAKAVYVPPRGPHPGHLLWLEGRSLQARPFDAATLQWRGEPVSLAEGVAASGATALRAGFWTSETGLLVVAHGDVVPQTERLVWVDRTGKPLGDAQPPANFGAVAISPDERHAAFAVAGFGPQATASTAMFDDIWILDIARQTTTRLTFGKGYDNHNPVWSPDGRQVAFSSNRERPYYQLYRKDVSGDGEEERLATFPKHMDPLDWSPDGRFLLYREQNRGTGWDLFLLPLEGDRTPIPLVVTPTGDSGAKFSPDGKWVAFHSRVNSPQPDLFLQAFSGEGQIGLTGPRIQISSGGGSAPVWRRDGRELYYHQGDGTVLVVPLAYGSRLQIGNGEPLFKASMAATQNQPKDALGDGSRFLLVLTPIDKPLSARMTVMTNWQAAR